MSKKFFVCLMSGILMSMGAISVARAQDNRPVSLGITFSPNISWLRYGDAEGYDGRTGLGFAYGLLADFGVSENYYFSTGLLINSLWSDATVPNSLMGPQFRAAGFIDKQFRLQYVEIPVAVKLKSTQLYHRSYYGKFGFTPGVKISGRERINEEKRRSTIEGASLFRLGLQIGGGVEWQLDHNLGLMTGLTFNNGFTRTIKDGTPKSSYLSLDFGILF